MSAGFYRDTVGFLEYAENFVFNEDYTLIKEDKDELIALDVFPIDRWYWFDSKEDAVAQLGVDFYQVPVEVRERPAKIEKPNPRTGK